LLRWKYKEKKFVLMYTCSISLLWTKCGNNSYINLIKLTGLRIGQFFFEEISFSASNGAST